MIMMNEFGYGSSQRLLAEENHPIETSDQVSRTAAHQRDAGTRQRRARQSRFSEAGSRADRGHDEHLRARASVGAERSGGENGFAVEVGADANVGVCTVEPRCSSGSNLAETLAPATLLVLT